jgi:CzcA family heavy metal efflux pump
MLNKLIQFSLAQRSFVLVIALALLGFGLNKALNLPVDVLPDLTKPTVTILTEAPGYAPEEVETLVTIPLESALMGVTGVTRLRSTNDISLSLIFVEFDWDTDIETAYQLVQQRLSGSSETLPEGVTPYLAPITSLMGDIMMVGVRDPSGKTTPRELRVLADWVVARRFQAIPGIAEVLSMGGGVQQIQVQPLPDKMLALGVTFEQIRSAAANAVSNTTGGFLTEKDQEIMVRNLAMTTDLDAIGNTVVVHENDRAIRLADVAKIEWGIEPMRGDAGMGTKLKEFSIDEDPEPEAETDGEDQNDDATTDSKGTKGDPGVIINVRKSPGFDTIALTEEVETAIEELRSGLPEGVQLLVLYRQQDFIKLAIGNLKEALLEGAIMVTVVLFLFLFNFRVTLITLTAIPLSGAITVLVFDLLDLSVNSMTLGGLAVAIGMVVDDAIVDVENVFRRLRENAVRTEPKPKLEVIARASAEVRSSIFYATLLIILVFIPLLALSGVAGRLFTPIAIATIVSMAASFVVSLTVIPVLSSFLLNPKAGREHRDGLIIRALKKLFTLSCLRPSLSQPLVLFAITAGLLFVSYVTFTKMGGAFLPAFREPTAVIAMTTAPGTSLKTTTELSRTAQDLLLRIPGVETVGYRVGRAERGDHVVPVSTVEFDVEFTEQGAENRTELLAEIRDTMKSIPGTFSAMSGPLADRVGHMLSGVSAKVAVKIYGPDLDELRRLGEEVASIARAIPGLETARTEQQAPIPQLRIEVDRDRALAYGVTPGDLNRELASLMGGEVVAEIYENQRVFDLVVRLPLEWRENPERLKELYIDTQSDQRIPLSYVADIRQATGPNAILREDTRRRFVVSINPTTADLNRVVEQLESEIDANIARPDGYRIVIEGEYVAQKEAKKVIVTSSLLVFVFVCYLLQMYFRSFSFVALVLTNIPVSLIGAVLFTRMQLDNVSIATLVGFIAVAGIAARNQIMMISHYLHLMSHEGESFSRDMVIRGTLERLVPVLMTALSAGIALIPLVLAADQPGKEILNPVAVVIVGGLFSSTLLGLALTPAIFYHFCRKPAQRAVARKVPACG